MRLIDADALQNILLPITTALEHEYGSLGGAVSGCMKLIDNALTINALPVVRCRECKHFRPYEGEEHKGDCAELVGLESCVYEDDFCSYGERKEGADND